MDAQDRVPTAPMRGLAALLLCLFPLVAGASHRSPNFVVDAPTREIAERVAECAEECRTAFAKEWLGHEMPPWSIPCPIKVKINAGEAGGLTSFGFTQGRVTDQRITVVGRLDRILASALPHEVTHTIFASYFGGPMPRWADEGASLLSEDQRERSRHDQIVADLISRGGEYPLSRLFRMEEYPKDLMSFYGQGYSISRFLIEMGGRPRFLQFVKEGLENNWDTATRNHYSLANVRELDRAWRSWHRVALTATTVSNSTGNLAARRPTAAIDGSHLD